MDIIDIKQAVKEGKIVFESRIKGIYCIDTNTKECVLVKEWEENKIKNQLFWLIVRGQESGMTYVQSVNPNTRNVVIGSIVRAVRFLTYDEALEFKKKIEEFDDNFRVVEKVRMTI